MSSITRLTNASSHAKYTTQAESTGKPTIIYVSNSSLPACKTFTPKYEELAFRYSSSHDISFAQMDFTSETSMLFKFAPNQLPVLTLMCRDEGGNMWAKTIMGANLRELESGIEEMLSKAGRKK